MKGILPKLIISIMGILTGYALIGLLSGVPFRPSRYIEIHDNRY